MTSIDILCMLIGACFSLLIALALYMVVAFRKEQKRANDLLERSVENERMRLDIETQNRAASFEAKKERIWNTVVAVANRNPDIPSDELACRLLSAQGIIDAVKPGKNGLAVVIDELNTIAEANKHAAAA